jgi:hypothetical protein
VGASEVLVTLVAAQAAGISITGFEHRTLALKGKSEPTEVVVFGPST